jgi:hypothetical protein
MKQSLLVLSLVLSFVTSAGAYEDPQLFRSRHNDRTVETVIDTATPAPTDDKVLVEAIAKHKNIRFLEAAHLKVVALLKDDSSGLPHQKFNVVTSTGVKVLCVYNLDQGQRIPLKIGDEVGLGGEFKWTNVGPLMHWLHEDSSNKRPDGYVELAGRRYGLN